MPGTIGEGRAEGKRELLASILQSYILKDIRGLVREENIGAFNAIMYSLAQEEGQVIRPAALAGDARVSEPTVARHLDILSAIYVTLQVPSYSSNLANELRKSREEVDFVLVTDRMPVPVEVKSSWTGGPSI